MSPRPPKFTFYLDENFPLVAGKFFRRLGHAVIDGRKRSAHRSDFYHLAEATKQGAILVSLDRDFLVNPDLQWRVFSSSGALYIETTSTNLVSLGLIIRKVLKQATAQSFAGKLCVASNGKIKFFTQTVHR